MSITNTVASVTTVIRGLINDQQQTDGKNLFEYDTDTSFTLSEPFIDITSFVVYQNNEVLATQDYSYDSDSNRLTISFVTSGKVLTKNDLILITYDYYKKYSDIEISAFLNSSLGYFVQHRFKKTFEIDSNDLIVAIDDFDPTTNELYFISIISAILVDPQNISIKTSDFTLTAKRNISDQEQIAKAFAQFKRFVGSISFEISNL